jgi:hypothetical protein
MPRRPGLPTTWFGWVCVWFVQVVVRLGVSDTVGSRRSITAGRVDGLTAHVNAPLGGTVSSLRSRSTKVCFSPAGEGAPFTTSVWAGSTGEVSVTNSLVSVSLEPAGARPVSRACLDA